MREVQKQYAIDPNKPNRLDIYLTPTQSRVKHAPQRNVMWVAGRRSGKTTLELTELIESAANFRHSLNWFCAPTNDQSKDIAWEPLLDMLEPTNCIAKTREGPIPTVELRNGSWIQCRGTLERRRLRGKGIGRPLKYVVFDEWAQHAPEVYTEVVAPMLADSKMQKIYGELGRCAKVGTPEGFNHFKDERDRIIAGDLPDWALFETTTLEGGLISLAEILRLKNELTVKGFNQEMLARFEALEGRVFYAFQHSLWPAGNVDNSIGDDGSPLLIGMDFNVDPMTAVVGQRKPAIWPIRPFPEFWVWKEYSLKNSNTAEMMKAIRADFPDRHMVVFPDPTGDSRHTNAPVGVTDHAIIRQFGAEVYSPSGGYPVKDRLNHTNGWFLNANDVRRIRVHGRCRILLNTLDGLCYKPGTSLPNKKSGLDHPGDALGYVLMGVFPPSVMEVTVTQFAV